MECGDLEFELFSFTFSGVSFDATHLPLLVLPLPNLTPRSPVTAYSLLAGRLVCTFAHGIALLPWVDYWAILAGVCAGWTRMISFVGFGCRVE